MLPRTGRCRPSSGAREPFAPPGRFAPAAAPAAPPLRATPPPAAADGVRATPSVTSSVRASDRRAAIATETVIGRVLRVDRAPPSRSRSRRSSLGADGHRRRRGGQRPPPRPHASCVRERVAGRRASPRAAPRQRQRAHLAFDAPQRHALAEDVVREDLLLAARRAHGLSLPSETSCGSARRTRARIAGSTSAARTRRRSATGSARAAGPSRRRGSPAAARAATTRSSTAVRIGRCRRAASPRRARRSASARCACGTSTRARARACGSRRASRP